MPGRWFGSGSRSGWSGGTSSGGARVARCKPSIRLMSTLVAVSSIAGCDAGPALLAGAAGAPPAGDVVAPAPDESAAELPPTDRDVPDVPGEAEPGAQPP